VPKHVGGTINIWDNPTSVYTVGLLKWMKIYTAKHEITRIKMNIDT
jgi:hypothetical protein